MIWGDTFQKAFLSTIVSVHIVLFFATIWPGLESWHRYVEAAIRLNALIFYIYITLFFLSNCIPCAGCVR